MHSAIELRKTKRYPLSAPVYFLWATQDGKPQCGRGVTRDINTFGVYVLADVLPPVGALVQMEIALPKLRDTGSGMQLHGEGVVLRGEPHGSTGAGSNEAGFAASVQFYPEAMESVLSDMKTSGQVV
jgi:hypothetical protein